MFLKSIWLLPVAGVYLIISCSNTTNKSVNAIYSYHVKDSFELYVDFPPNYSKDSNNSIVFYMDANLRMGKEIRKQIKLDKNKVKLENVIFVGVGHIGNYRKLRRRDFIPPIIENGRIVSDNDPDFGHGEDFYKFLTIELIPYINKKYPNNGYYSFIGHSLSGLFSFYCFMQPENPFKNHVALSPSLWINHNNFFELEKEFKRSSKGSLNVTLYHACGTREWANKVLTTSRKMHEILIYRNYPGLNYIYQEHQGKAHNGVVPVSLEYVLNALNFRSTKN
jgi:predicted alpha/beta superfamily hydrolase